MFYWDLDTFQQDYHDQYGNIMQYTGLKDKNGKEIYEGDIVVKNESDWDIMKNWPSEDPRWNDKSNYPMKETNRDYVTLKIFRFWLKNERFGYEGEDLQNPVDYEIIGNIHQNPELL